jgi:GntR family transcriptional regulator/MocR family aminotransferase
LPELLVTLDPASPDALHLQLERRLRDDVRAGRLAAGTVLPSTRELAAELGVSRGVVVEAYAQLRAEGYLSARRGSGTRVAGGAAAGANAAAGADGARAPVRPAPASSRPRPPRYDLHPGMPDVAEFPREAWAAAARRALLGAPPAALGYGSPRGPRAVRDALAGHLGRVRGCVADPRRITMTSGHVQGIGLAFAALRARGGTRIAVEDPGFLGHRLVADHAGLETVPIAVDGDGLRVEDLERADAGAVVVTPAHQSPMGVVLAPARRAALLGWAERRDALVIEDDYDAEYRYDREPVGTLQGLAPERVLYAGSASKVLAPGLRLGWLLSPSWLDHAVAEEKSYADLGTPVLEQLTLADFIATGAFERHLRRMRRLYRARRDALLHALAAELPEATVHGVAAGLHVVVLLPEPLDEHAWLAAALRRGVQAPGMAPNRFAPGPPGAILGYASLPEPALRHAVALLAEAYREVT